MGYLELERSLDSREPLGCASVQAGVAVMKRAASRLINPFASCDNLLYYYPPALPHRERPCWP